MCRKTQLRLPYLAEGFLGAVGVAGCATALASAACVLPLGHSGSSESSPHPGESEASAGALTDGAHLFGVSPPTPRGCGFDP